MTVPFKRLRRHDGLVVDQGDNPAPSDSAAVEHAKRLADGAAAYQPNERVDAEHVEAVVGQSAVGHGAGEAGPGPAGPTTEALVQ